MYLPHIVVILCTAAAAAAADIWDTAGQERFNSMHASYYYRAHVSSNIIHAWLAE
jgi:hypothetical protein